MKHRKKTLINIFLLKYALHISKTVLLEREFIELSLEEIQNKRLARGVPIWEIFFAWFQTLHSTKGSKPEKVVYYAQNHKETLRNFLLDERCKLSNYEAERIQSLSDCESKQFEHIPVHVYISAVYAGLQRQIRG